MKWLPSNNGGKGRFKYFRSQDVVWRGESRHDDGHGIIPEILGYCATEQEVEQDCNDEIIVVKVVEYDVNASRCKPLLTPVGISR